MPSNRTLTYLLIVLIYSCPVFYGEFLNAQQPASNVRNESQKIIAQPFNPKLIDSLANSHSLRSRINFSLKQGPLVLNKIERKTSSPSKSSRPISRDRNASNDNLTGAAARPNTVCYTISGRDFLKQDSLILYVGDPTMLKDGNVFVSGEFADYSTSPLEIGGFCMKTDILGNVIWAKLYDSTADVTYDYINYFRSIELKDGSILVAGRTTNTLSKNDDFILTKLDANGNQDWTTTYESRFWQGFNGSGDYFNFRDLKQDPVTGDIYFVGSLWGGFTTITKVDDANGRLIWSNGYDSWGTDHPFGIVIEPGHLLLFQLEYSYSDSYINIRKIDKLSGDTLSGKHLMMNVSPNLAQMYNTYSVVKLNNGHYRMSGPTTAYWEYPVHTGTKDLYHAAVVELDNNFDFVNAYGFKNRVQSNGYNTKVTLFPDGTGVFTMLDVLSGYNAEALVSIFKDDLIYHQRKRLHNNEGLPYEPPTLQLSDGGYLNIKLMGDSTLLAVDGSKIDYHRMYSSDTASVCLGIKNAATSTWHFSYSPAERGMAFLYKNVFSESRIKQYGSWNFRTTQEPSCVVISHCDTLTMKANTTKICPGNSVIITVGKNKECGSLVPLVYDTSFVDQVIKLTDSTYEFHFEKPGSGYIRGSLMGCILREDSVFVEVLPVRYSLDLGVDTVLCPGNQLKLNAGRGFASYVWQDGSADSTFLITQPGIYHVTVVNGCGTIYKDTVEVKDHPPIPISIGPDRFKCNDDTLELKATPGFLNYKWTPDYNISSLSSQTIVVNPLVDTVYMVAAEKKPGCFAYDTVRVKVGISAKINLGADTSICRNDALTLDAGPGFSTYLWSTGDSQRTLYVDQPGDYFVKATMFNGCNSFDTLTLLSLYNLPQPNLGPDSVVCLGQPRVLSSGNQYTAYQWSNGSVNSSITIQQPGQYWIEVTDANGCRGNDTTIVPSLEQRPGAFLGPDTAICSYSDLTLEPSSNFVRHWWSTGATLRAITIKQPGTYWLEVVDDHNCIGRDTVIIAQKDCMEGLYVPSAFTPNRDGLNDVFTPLIFGDIRSFRFSVYNRWGKVVFETTTVGKGWDGSAKGMNQDSNVFVWTCTYQLNGKKTEQKSGKVVLIR